ncbi:MAG: FAD-dependent monooxygenase [Alphaproteobacteria bacterium]|nr:FAD-dependent monooxygenase [Alphaproteobacteria bacterium]
MTDVAVIGAGPAGLCAALAMAQCGLPTAIIAAPHRPAGDRPDTRTAALFNPSINLLKNLGVWENYAEACAPLTGIRLIDDTGGLFRAPQVTFNATEIGSAQFGYNIPQGPLVTALRQAAQRAENLTIIESNGARTISPDKDHVEIITAEGNSYRASLVLASDGRNSITRQAAGITATTTNCNQVAVTCTFAHSRPHHGISTEFHRKAGPLTVVPMPENHSSLVWVERPDVAQRLLGLDDATFLHTLETNLQGLLGDLSNPGPRASFPLSHMSASSMGQNRIALVGESAHAMPPIGAQGLNLSLRDVADLAELVGNAASAGADIGSEALLISYGTRRSRDASERSFAVRTMNEALLSEFLPVHLARGASLHAINAFAPLRQAAMRLGMAPPRDLPPLMQAAPLTPPRYGLPIAERPMNL